MNIAPYGISKKLLTTILLSSVCLFFSCNNHTKKNRNGQTLTPAEDAFSNRVKALLPPIDSIKKVGIGNIEYNIKYTYQLNDYLPVWIKQSMTPSTAAEHFLNELEEVWQDGINPEKYHLSAIRKLMVKLNGKDTSVSDAIAFDTMLTRSYLSVAKDLLLGELTPRKADSLWFHANDSSWEAPKMLAGMGDSYFSINDFRSTFPTYLLIKDEYKRYHDLVADTMLRTAIGNIEITTAPDSGIIANAALIIKKEMPWAVNDITDSLEEFPQLVSAYQYYEGLKMTGTLDTTTLKHMAIQPDVTLKILRANMERIRWMQQKFGNLYVFVDIPLMELFLRKDGADSMHMRVVVGKPVRQTPSLYAVMANIVINPRWEVPPTILKQDVLPGIEKTGKKYLSKKGLKVYDREGNPVNASLVTAKNYRRYNYQQAPGDDNALGYVKFNLPNPFDIYLHDTPHRGDFVKRERALSSGCIRLQQPEEMAVFIFSEIEKKRYTKGKLDSIIKTHKTQWQVLKNKIPVHISYLTAFEDSTHSHVRLLNDVYGRDEKLISLLSN